MARVAGIRPAWTVSTYPSPGWAAALPGREADWLRWPRQVSFCPPAGLSLTLFPCGQQCDFRDGTTVRQDRRVTQACVSCHHGNGFCSRSVLWSFQPVRLWSAGRPRVTRGRVTWGEPAAAGGPVLRTGRGKDAPASALWAPERSEGKRTGGRRSAAARLAPWTRSKGPERSEGWTALGA